jgi:hypothetical protein
MNGFLSLVFVAPVAAIYKNLPYSVFSKKAAHLIELRPEGVPVVRIPLQEEVQIVDSGRIVARIVPPLIHDLSPKTPDYVGRAQAIWGAKPESATLSEIVHDSRGTGA